MHLLENLPGYVSHELGGEIKAIFTHKPHITVLTFQEEVSYMLSLEGQMPHSSLAFILSLPIRPLLFLLPPGQVCLLLFPLFFTSSLSFSLSLANYPECRMSDLIFTQFRVHFFGGRENRLLVIGSRLLCERCGLGSVGLLLPWWSLVTTHYKPRCVWSSTQRP